MNILITTAVSLVVTLGSFVGAYKYLPLGFLDTPSQNLGSTITTILGTDTLSASRSVINTNFSNLNADKAETTVTSLASLTSAAVLATIGTITTGVWNGTAITGAYGGTSSTTLSGNQVMLGNGTSGLKTVSGWGTSGQFLTSGGTTVAPTWTTAAVDQAGTYTWTGGHIFTASSTHSATTTIVANSVTNNALVLNGVAYQFPTANALGVLRNDNAGTLTWGAPVRYTIASTTLNSLTSTGVQTTYATSTLITIPANTLTASSTMSFKGHNTSIATGNADTICTASIKVGNTFIGTVTLPTRDGADGTDINIWEMEIYSNNSVSSQTYFSTFNSSNATPGTVVGGSDGSSSIDFSSAQTLLFVISTKSQSGGTSSECTHESLFVEINP